MLYYYLKLIHVISSTILFGTGLGSAFYMYRAHLSKDERAILFATKNVILADWLFTTPAVIVQPITGFWLVYIMGYSLLSPWIIISLCLYVLVGLCWLPVVWIQIKMHQFAKEAIMNNRPLFQDSRYLNFFKLWYILGWPAFIGVIIIFYLMVVKPSF